MIRFNGETYPSQGAWIRAFPAYGKAYVPLVIGGADTTMKLEQAIQAKRTASRAASMAGVLKSPVNNSRKAKAARGEA